MQGVQLKLNGKWVSLPEGFSLSLEQKSPLFNEQDTYSFPFEVSVDANRSLFGNLKDPIGSDGPQMIHDMPAELWFNGMQLYIGRVEVDDEMEIEETVGMTFIARGSDYAERMEDLKAQDVPLKDDIYLGWYAFKAEAQVTYVSASDVLPGTTTTKTIQVNLPVRQTMKFTGCNVSDPYPAAKYCNVRICTQGVNTDGEKDGYVIMEAQRQYSGICFYVLYFVDCLFNNMGIRMDYSAIEKYDDLFRLAFFTTKCKTKQSEEMIRRTAADVDGLFTVSHVGKSDYLKQISLDTKDFEFLTYDLYASSENFPDEECSTILDDLKNAFGLRLLFDDKSSSIKVIALRDVFADNDVRSFVHTVLDVVTTKFRPMAYKVTYGGGDDDTNYYYDDYTNAVEYADYNAVIEAGIDELDTTCKIDRTTGNAYRVKVDKDSGQGASLFEVGGFRDYVTSPKLDDEHTEEISMSFKPVVVNLVKDSRLGVFNGIDNYVPKKTNNSSVYDGYATLLDYLLAKEEVKTAIFADVEFMQGMPLYSKIKDDIGYTLKGKKQVTLATTTITSKSYEVYDEENNEKSPLEDYDAGYVLGIMRGPGNEAGMEYDTNYDNEGNDAWSQVAADYAFTSDLCDNFGRYYDYNGKEDGGLPGEGNFSLKLVAEKPGFDCDSRYKHRGLVDTFLSEYLYFMTHKRVVTIAVDMNLADIICIDYTKRYKVAEYVGYINKVSYTIDQHAVRDIMVELWII